ncbi:23S rRNA (uracil(1939)-C(5))-methyltransferase RlmD [Ferrimonas marina]|uniref:23S rRNA (uracil(1939)-C(5))-methyltransferase RlmD n=1 Tax=Ferrimonas marina TaxID=299255 RepID=A0A1M5ZTP9_9GAMM|nr:23S rRNA (uracil(1939)-C(5))-methyltransferase RlmD [Ferrimonas marina]SHI27572.1 23S rRNA (uracil1939-C5)-methyltransferase [Ferrimonas marina]
MAQFYSAKSKKTKILPKSIEVRVDAMDHQGNGVANHQGKVVFVKQLLPGERGRVRLVKDKHRFAEGQLEKRLDSHPERVAPHCPYFSRCGGCNLQYASVAGQHQFKQQALQDLLTHKLGAVPPLAPVISGPDWHYRRRARIGVRRVKGALLMGFRQEGTNRLTDIDYCPVLAAPLSSLIQPLKTLLAELPLANQVGHLDLLLAEEGPVVVLRLLRDPSREERQALAQFAQHQAVTLLWQGDDAVRTLENAEPLPMHYSLGGDRPQPAFLPGDFFQVNDQVNQGMISQAIQWLAPQADEVGLDLFCGGGNFTFALAPLSRRVIGVEGVEAMVVRGRRRAQVLGLDNVEFHGADLNSDEPDPSWQRTVDWVLLDPARAGACGALDWLTALKPKRILYVSCNPLSLSKDAKVLLQKGYSLQRLGLIEMFPHTHHLESMALFVPAKP